MIRIEKLLFPYQSAINTYFFANCGVNILIYKAADIYDCTWLFFYVPCKYIRFVMLAFNGRFDKNVQSMFLKRIRLYTILYSSKRAFSMDSL